jgi:hypothetical protein
MPRLFAEGDGPSPCTSGTAVWEVETVTADFTWMSKVLIGN